MSQMETSKVMDRIPQLVDWMGPAFTFGKHALKALKNAAMDDAAWNKVQKALDGNAEWADVKPAWDSIKKKAAGKVDWDKVEKKTVIESIEEHGQDPDDVAAVIGRFSPNCQSEEKRTTLKKVIDGMAPDLAKRYDQVRAKIDAEYESKKAANNGISKFVAGPGSK